MTISPEFTGNFSALSLFLVYKDEIRSWTDKWSALGMYANHSGPIVVEGVFSTDRLIGLATDGRKIMKECVDPYFLLLTCCVWSGIALGCLDLARRHVTRSAHADVGMRVCDYPVIQDYFGESLIDTNTTRCMTYLLAQTLDSTTGNNDWDIHSDLSLIPREEMTNQRVVQREVKKMTTEQKEELGKKLLEEAQLEKAAGEAGASTNRHPYQDTDFLNPFNTTPPAALSKDLETSDGVVHKAALKPDQWTPFTLLSRQDLTDKMAAFIFSLPNPTDHTGCYPGQYVLVRVKVNGKEQLRYFSPVSRPDDHGKIELVLRYETQGLVSNFFKELQPGSQVEFQGPCGGLEYTGGVLDEVTVVAGGGRVTPGIQLLRSLAHNPEDTTKMTLLYYAETPSDILYRAELDGYAKNDKRVRVVYSVGEGGEGWEGEEGFIDTQLLDKYVTKPNDAKHKVVICGGPSMSISALYSSQQLGFPPQAVFIYGQFGVEQVKAVYGKNAALASHTCHQLL